MFIAIAEPVCDLPLGVRGHKGNRMDAAPRILDKRHLFEGRFVLGEHRFEDLLQRLVNGPHERHAMDKRLAVLNDGAAEQVGGEKAEKRDRADGDNEPNTRH